MIALIPVDTTGLPEGVEIPKPSISHTLMPCDACSRDCWIGPQQARARVAASLPALCYFCLIPVMAAAKVEFTVYSLDPKADEVPRRT
jgi:hypothetical protein